MPVRFTFELNSQTLQTLPSIANIDGVSTKAQNRKNLNNGIRKQFMFIKAQVLRIGEPHSSGTSAFD